MNNQIVFSCSEHYVYPSKTYGFRPSEKYPEYPFEEIAEESNYAYELFREALVLGEYDRNNYGTDHWNPLKDFVHPGDTVLIKPNLVMDHNPTGDGVECLFTQPGLIAAAIDYVIIAFQKKPGKIVVGDAPMQECNFEKLIQESGLDILIEFYKKKGYEIQLVDFRGLKSKIIHGIHHSDTGFKTNGTIIDLGADSEFSSCSSEELKRLRITNYNPALLNQHHNTLKNEYFVSNYMLSADVVINMPKPKTHRKAGITGALKNMVGINVRKEFLPHHTLGAKDGKIGDEYKRTSINKALSSFFKDKKNSAMSSKHYVWAYLLKNISRVFFYTGMAVGKDCFSEGSWYGNETISRTICDLNKILMYADKNGIMRPEMQRKIFIIGDMIVSGEKEGPVEPSKKDVGMIVIGENPVLFDECLASIMGVNPSDIPTIRQAKSVGKPYQLIKSGEGIIISNRGVWNKKHPSEIKSEDSLMYIPTSGWRKVFYSTKTND